MNTTIQLLVSPPIQLRQSTTPTLLAQVAGGETNILLSTTPTLLAQVKGGAAGPGVDLLTTRGDLLTHETLEPVRLPVGLDGQTLTANSTAPEGLLWNGLVIRRSITEDLTVQAGTSAVQRDAEVADGVDVVIEDTGEILAL